MPRTLRPLVLQSLAVLLSGAVVSLAQPLPQRPVFVQRRVVPTAAHKPPEPISDVKALEAAGLKADEPAGLLAYLRQRTLTDVDLSKVQAVIKRLGADDFDERLRASVEVERLGPAAVGPLRTAAESDPDPEVAYRASESLQRIEKVPHSATAAAAVRALAQTKPPGTAEALLGFLPLADNAPVADLIRQTLVQVAVRDGKAEPALVAALTNTTAPRRVAAAVALVEGGPAGERVRIPDAYPKVLQAVAAEKDPEAKFQMLFPLLTVAREQAAVGQLIDLLPDLPRGRLWQAEDYLLQFAGQDAPRVVFGKSKESLTAAQEAWKEWWAKAASAHDITAFAYTPRISGRTLLTLLDGRGYQSGQVVELGPDMKERWRITGLSNPLDAQVLSDGTVAIAEQSASRVTIRTTDGQVVATRTITDPTRGGPAPPHQVQALANGNLLVTSQNVVAECRTAGKDEVVMQFVRDKFDIRAARRLASGETVVVAQNAPNVVFLDAGGKPIAGRDLSVKPSYMPGSVDEPAPGRLLLTEQTRVVEFDLKDGKAEWSKPVNQPRSVQRLPNGNTVVVESTGSTSRVVELTPDGEEVWTYQPTSGFQVYRAYRR